MREHGFTARRFGHEGFTEAVIARKKGGTLLYDKGSLIYADPAYDITSEVLTEVTKAKPAATAPR